MADHDRPSKVTFVRGNARLHGLLRGFRPPGIHRKRKIGFNYKGRDLQSAH